MRSWSGDRGRRRPVQAEEYCIRSHPLVHTKPCLAYSIAGKCNGRGSSFPTRRTPLGFPADRCGPSSREGSPSVSREEGPCSPRRSWGRSEKDGSSALPPIPSRPPGSPSSPEAPTFSSAKDVCGRPGRDRGGEEAPHGRPGGAHRQGRGRETARPHPLQPALFRKGVKKLLGEAREIFPGSFLTGISSTSRCRSRTDGKGERPAQRPSARVDGCVGLRAGPGGVSSHRRYPLPEAREGA